MRLCQWLLCAVAMALSASVADAGKAGGRSLDGAEIQADLPGAEHRHNVSSRGEGCCVQTSLNHSARWQNVPALVDFQLWVQQKGLPGGAWPGAIDERIPACCKDRGYPTAAYLQSEGMDLELLRLACKTGRMPAITFSNAGNPLKRYDGHQIAHMVSLVAAGVGSGPDGKGWWVILDNNYPGEDAYGWLSEEEFRRAYSPGWAVILLDAAPPPPPHNGRTQTVYGQAPRPVEPARCSCSPECVCGCQDGGPCPCGGAEARRPRPENHGLDLSRVRDGRCSLNGEECSREALVRRLSNGTLVDDSKLQRVTVISRDEAKRKRVLLDWTTAPELAPFRGLAAVKDYSPDHWAMRDAGFRCGADVTIYVQAPDGRVLHRQDGYDGPKGLATALRRAQPDYDPSKDPDLLKPVPFPLPVPQPGPVGPATPGPVTPAPLTPEPARPDGMPASSWLPWLLLLLPVSLGTLALALRRKG